jgi:hypothetical protein
MALTYVTIEASSNTFLVHSRHWGLPWRYWGLRWLWPFAHRPRKLVRVPLQQGSYCPFHRIGHFRPDTEGGWEGYSCIGRLAEGLPYLSCGCRREQSEPSPHHRLFSSGSPWWLYSWIVWARVRVNLRSRPKARLVNMGSYLINDWVEI